MNTPPRCRAVERQPSTSARDVAGSITLDETDRHRRRFAMTSDEGLAFVLELEQATLLRDGDVLVLDDGRRLVVRAAPEPLYEVRARSAHHLLRLAWHVGNRHLPTQVMDDHLRIRRDPVIGDMLVGLGGEVSEIAAGFDPEGGAYDDPESAHARGPAHVHDPVRERAHDHSHDHRHAHVHDHPHGHGHEHVGEDGPRDPHVDSSDGSGGGERVDG